MDREDFDREWDAAKKQFDRAEKAITIFGTLIFFAWIVLLLTVSWAIFKLVPVIIKWIGGL